jgi:hypothetical protein
MQAVERSMRYRDDQKGGMLAWKLCREGRFIDDVAVHSNVGGGLRALSKEKEGGRNSKYKQTIVTQYMTTQ